MARVVGCTQRPVRSLIEAIYHLGLSSLSTLRKTERRILLISSVRTCPSREQSTTQQRRRSERQPADSLRDRSNVIGGWLPSLTFALGEKGTMELVAFISCETGTDLIVSFAVCALDDSSGVESFTLMRTPIFEGFLPEWERGATVSFEREKRKEAKFALLREVKYAAEEKIVTVTSDHRVYELDVRKVDPKELKEMCRVLRKMNHDSSVKFQGV